MAVDNNNNELNPDELYKEIEHCFDIFMWIKYRIKNSSKRLVLCDFSDNYFNAFLDAIPFRVELYDGTRLILKVSDDYGCADEILPELKRVIAPIVWHLGKNQTLSGDYANYRSEVISYKFDTKNIFTFQKETVRVVAYDVKDAKQLVADVVNAILIEKAKMNSVEVKYTKVKYEDVVNEVISGNNAIFADSEFIEKIKNCTEFELYLYTKNVLYELAARIGEVSENGGDITSDKLTKYLQNAYSFLIIQSKRFGVFINDIPGKPLDNTTEHDAWYLWWDEAYENLMKNHQEVLENWKTLPNGYDEKFRPSSSFDEYYDLYLQVLDSDIRAEEEAERKEKSAKVMEVVDILKAEMEKRKKEIERGKTPQGRAESLIENIFKKVKDNSLSKQLSDFVTNTLE